MRRLALAAAAALALVPAALGLFGNDSLAQNVPASIPASAELLTVDVVPTGTPTPTRTVPTAAPSSTTRVDDHGGERTTRTSEPGDDHGGDRDRSGSGSSEPGDDQRSGGHGSDDGPGHD